MNKGLAYAFLRHGMHAGFISHRIITSVLEFLRFLYVFMISVDKKRLAVSWSKKASFKDIASKRFQVPGLHV